MDKRFLAILAAIIAVFIGIFVITSSGSDNGGGGGSKQPPSNHVKGQGKTGVKLVEYGDFQCPACKQFEPLVRQVYAKFSKDIYFQFRNLPLTIHQNARAGAKAAEAASLQGKYWQMHDKLYDNQSAWAESANALTLFKGYAQEIGLNMTKFSSDFANAKTNAIINADLAAFAKTGQEQSTPSFFLDGKYVANKDVSSLESFSQVINQQIKKRSQ